jgi:hypothetical protein
MYLSTTEVFNRVKYLIGKEEGEYTYGNVRKILKNKCKIYKRVKSDYYYFYAEEVWTNYFMNDEKLKKILNHRKILSIYELLQYGFEDLYKLRKPKDQDSKKRYLREKQLFIFGELIQ